MKNRSRAQWLHALGGAPAGRGYLAALTLVGLAVLAISTVFNQFGLIHHEWRGYISFHLGPGSVWAKIFDNRTLDQGIYAGRELSYLVDHVDMLAMAFSVKAGFPVFTSLMHALLSVFIGVWLAGYAARDLKLGALVGLLLALLFWTTPYVYLHFLMRTAKGLTAAGLVVLVIEICRAGTASAGRKDARLSRRSVALIGLAATAMSFSDRQGFYFLLCAIGFMAVEWALGRTRAGRDIFLLLLAVLVVELVYFFWVAPALTAALWGYESDFSFNQLPWGELWARPAYFAGQAGALLLESIGFTLGHIPSWSVVAVVLAILASAVARDIRFRSWQAHVPLSALIAVMLAALWAMDALMILRHPPVLWPDVRTAYYWIPAAVLVLLGVLGGVGGWVARQPVRKTVFVGVLVVAVVGNIAALPGHRWTFANGHLQNDIRQSGELRDAMVRRTDAGFALPDELADVDTFRMLYELAPVGANAEVLWEQFWVGGFYRRTHGPGAPASFVEEFGGNVDSRLLSAKGRFLRTDDGRSFLGTTAGSAEMRVAVPSNRLRGELILQRVGADASVSLAASFLVQTQPRPNAEPRYERWRGRLELPAGQRTVSASYEIDSSGLPALFTLEIPPEFAGLLSAGWRNPQITHVGRDASAPAWFFPSGSPAVVLDEAALATLLPENWRPVRALMRNGRVTADGIKLSPGGEIWLQARGLVSRFTGTAAAAPAERERMPVTRGFWYKGGRLQAYAPPAPENTENGAQSFQAWCAEPGGWLVIAGEPRQGGVPTVVRVTEVTEAR